MLWNQWFMNVQDYSCPTIVLLKEKVLLLLGLQVNDGIFKKWHWPTNQPTNKAGSRDAIASKKSIVKMKDKWNLTIHICFGFSNEPFPSLTNSNIIIRYFSCKATLESKMSVSLSVITAWEYLNNC